MSQGGEIKTAETEKQRQKQRQTDAETGKNREKKETREKDQIKRRESRGERAAAEGTYAAKLIKGDFPIAVAVSLLDGLFHNKAELFVANAVSDHHLQHLKQLFLVHKAVVVHIVNLKDNCGEDNENGNERHAGVHARMGMTVRQPNGPITRAEKRTRW